MTFNPGTSSVSKGESLKDTALTLQAMGCNLMVVRHQAVGAAHRIAEWVDCPVVNAGDGAHQHPTQALIDCLALRRRFGKLDGLRVSVVGDIRHSRVARSDAFAFTAMGASVTWVAPATLLPPSLEMFPVTATADLEPQLPDSDVIYLLRVQSERGATSGLPSSSEFAARYGMDLDRLARLPSEAVVMHPGPINRGVELAGAVADDPRSLIVEQVGVGVAVRMAVLFRLSGGQL
jgi:aspartate carbamoyltransferase catalytic subunit